MSSSTLTEAEIQRQADDRSSAVTDMALFPEMNPGPVCRIDRAGNILLANTAAKHFFGDIELQGKSWFDLCPGLDLDTWEKILTSNGVYPVEVQIGYTWMHFAHVCKGRREFVFVYGTDITQTKRAEEKLREQAKTIAEIARFPDMNPGPVLRLDLNAKILLSNAAAAAVLGEGLTGKNWLEVCPGIHDNLWEKIKASSVLTPVEAHIGDCVYLFNHRSDPKTSLVFVFGTDITANKRAEQKLVEQAATIAEIARFPDMNPGPVLRMDLSGCVLLSNAAATNVFGADLNGKKWLDICPGMDHKAWHTIVHATEVVPFEVRIRDREFVFNHRRDFQTDLVFTFGADVTLQKAAERGLRQSEKMATLGTLAAGIAHELNNPAAAVRRAAEQLLEGFAHLRNVYADLTALKPSEAEWSLIVELEKRIVQAATHPPDISSLDRSDRETEIEEWLEDHNIEDAWSLAPLLVSSDLTVSDMETVASTSNEKTIGAILRWLAAVYPVYSLLTEIGEGSSRISEIVVAMKSYSFLGQAPVQNVNIHEGLDNTLVILRSKMKKGVTVHREYATDLPAVSAYGGELNQVWTNLLDNAIDAMKGEGEITIRTRREDNWAVVEIEDNGPGIPPEIQSQVFDPFFTTKQIGKGTGLGLSTSYGIITEKHKGTIMVSSHPGSTTFTVKLPIDADASENDPL
jgi:signal transduction histidine kinase